MGENSASLFDQIFSGSWWAKQKDFPPCDEWKGKVEKYLQFMQDKGWLDLIKPKLQRRNYDSFLSEIFAAYFIETILGFEATRWNPETTKHGHSVEFCIKDKSGDKIFCEVKSPGWQGQLTKDEIDKGRAKEPKYLKSGNARYVAPYINIRETIKKSYRKFLSAKQNLLIITDNLFEPATFGPLVNWFCKRRVPRNIALALYNTDEKMYGGKGYFLGNSYENIGAILFLNNRYIGKLFAWFETNPNAKMPLSKEFVTEALKLNKQCIK